jgi:hypothetical protein
MPWEDEMLLGRKEYQSRSGEGIEENEGSEDELRLEATPWYSVITLPTRHWRAKGDHSPRD